MTDSPLPGTFLVTVKVVVLHFYEVSAPTAQAAAASYQSGTLLSESGEIFETLGPCSIHRNSGGVLHRIPVSEWAA